MQYLYILTQISSLKTFLKLTHKKHTRNANKRMHFKNKILLPFFVQLNFVTSGSLKFL